MTAAITDLDSIVEGGLRDPAEYFRRNSGPTRFVFDGGIGLAFAESCNTAFISASAGVPDADLVAAAESFGFNTDYSVGLNTFGGSFPTPADATEHAAASIGQGRVEASPLHMATVAAAVIDGTWDAPVLLPEPQRTKHAAGDASSRRRE